MKAALVGVALIGVAAASLPHPASAFPASASDSAAADAWLTEQIKQIHADSDGTYGARRIHAQLRGSSTGSASGASSCSR